MFRRWQGGLGGVFCVRNGSGSAEKWTNVSPWLEGAFVPAWIGFGHSFAAQDESDQAMVRRCRLTRSNPS